MSIIVIDVETGGLDPKVHPLIQVGAVACSDDWSVVERFERKVLFSVIDCTPGVLDTNHYDPVTWGREAIAEVRAVSDLYDFMRRYECVEKISKNGKPYRVARLCAHNVHFDMEFLLAAFRRQNQFFPGDMSVLCTVQLYRWSRYLRGEQYSSARLEDLCERYGIELTRAHDALADAEATARVAPRIIEEIKTWTR